MSEIKLTVKKVSKNKFFVEVDAELFTVDLRGENKDYIFCDCKIFRAQRKCPHIYAVKDFIDKEEPGRQLKVQRAIDAYSYREPYEKQIVEKLKKIIF